MRTISVITPVYKPRAEHLIAAAESISAQVLPDGWDLEWLVQEDGQEGEARKLLNAQRWIRPGQNRHSGPAVTRNLALARSTGEIVRNLDADDQLTEGALWRDIEALTAHPDVHWTTSRVLDLLPDGSTVGFDGDPSPGRIEPGLVFDVWRQNRRAPVHPTTLCVRRQSLVKIGGWAALPASEDTALLIAVSETYPGWFNAEPGLLYRKWPGQMTSSAEHSEPGEQDLRFALIEQRGSLIRATGGAA